MSRPMSGRLGFDAFKVALEGRNVVDASAGTGKTYAITTLVVRLVVERRLRIKDILVVTFTEAATAELRDRVRRRLREAWEAFLMVELGAALPDSDLARYAASQPAQAKLARQWLELALEEVDEAPISTIHGFCHRILQEAALESGLPFETQLTADARPLRDEAVFDFHSRDLAAQPFADAQAIVSATDLAQWRGLADKVFRGPDAKVFPPADENREALWSLAMAALRLRWKRAEIEKLLLGYAFSRPVRKNDLARWSDDIEQLLADGGMPAKASNGLQALVPAALRTRTLNDEVPAHAVFDTLERMLDLVRSVEKAGAQTVVAARLRFVDYLRTALPKLKQATGTITFDDLLLRLRDALMGPAAGHLVQVVRQQYKAALIDEFQDTDPVQFSIFEVLFANAQAPLFLIGDPKQAIYGFRGADVNAYLEAVEVPGTQHHTMGTNWRSDPLLVAAVNGLFAPNEAVPRPFVLNGIHFAPVQARPGAEDVVQNAAGQTLPPLDVALMPDQMGLGDESVAQWVAADIARVLSGDVRLDGQRVRPADVAVLARTNKQAASVQAALRALQIPAVLLGDTSVLDADEARELMIVLTAMAEPTNAAAMRQALATRLMGVSASALVQMEEDAALWSSWSERFRLWHQIWVEQGFVQAFRGWFEHENVGPRLLGYLDGERKITNLLHLMELIHRAAREGHLGPAGVLQWLGQGPRNAEGGVAPDEAQIRLESDEAAVKLTTVHRAKGLEYPIVYCPYVCHDFLLMKNDRTVVRFHDEDGRGALDLGSSQLASHLDKASWEALAENVRLLYVALTRARHRCTVVWGYREGIKETALAWLLFPLHQRDRSKEGQFGSLGRLDQTQLRAPIEAWQARAPGAVGCRVAIDEPGQRYVTDEKAAPLPGARVVQARVQRWQRTTSFSAMTSSAAKAMVLGHEVDVMARDRDESTSLVPTDFDRATHVPLADFPRGAKAGNFFHELLEVADFAASAGQLGPAVKAQLDLYRYPSVPWDQLVPSALVDVLGTPLQAHGDSFCLRDLASHDRLPELEFALPLSLSDQEGHLQEGHLQERLSQAFALGAKTDVERSYPKRVAQLQLGQLQGFVKGFVDLVFHRNGRFYLADYKTNHLGRAWVNYGTPQLEAAMGQGHYFLQSHLYALALHRHLSRTVPSYSYESHFGGVFYLFLRGMGGLEHGDSGVFFHRPPWVRMAALEALFCTSKATA